MNEIVRFCAVLAALTLLPSSVVSAQAVTDQWNAVVVPPAPDVKAVVVDPRTTVLFVMDFSSTGCTEEKRPRCVVALPHVRKLLDEARAHGMLVIHTLAGTESRSEIVSQLDPLPAEQVVSGVPDKFISAPNLAADLKTRGITTVITTGTSANGAVLHTAAGASLRGFSVIVPVDAMPGDTAFTEAYTVWHLTHASRVSAAITLTKVDEIAFTR